MAVEGVSRKRIQDEIAGDKASPKVRRSTNESGENKQSADRVSVGRAERPSPIDNSHAQRGRRIRHNDQEGSSQAANPSGSGSTGSTQESAPTTSSSSGDLKSLAARYVDQYAKESNKTLSADQKSALTEQVYSFYSDPARAGRLEKVVFANA